jgi:hypothetical protein
MQTQLRGQADSSAVGVTGCLVWIVWLVFVIVLGGTLRSQIVCPLPVTKVAHGQEVLFKETLNARHWVLGLVRGQQPDVRRVLDKNLQDRDQLIELTVATRMTIVDALLAGVTLGIYTPQTVDISGKIIRPGKPSEL